MAKVGTALRNPYEILGVARDAPDFVIQAAYRAAIKRYHPDLNAGSDARAKTEEVLSAFKILNSPPARAWLDERLRLEEQPAHSTIADRAPLSDSQPRLRRPGKEAIASDASYIGCVSTVIVVILAIALYAVLLQQ